jgi:hypothetical protein
LKRVEAQEAAQSHDLPQTHFDLAIVGESLDPRGAAAVAFLRNQSRTAITLTGYDADSYSLLIDGLAVDADDVATRLGAAAGEHAILEATTLGFVELFLALRALFEYGASEVDILYVEPDSYAKPHRSRSMLLSRREFELSEDVPGYRAIPGATIMLMDRVKHRGVFFLGFEERRLDVAFEDFQMLRPSDCNVVFGVPAFKAGWEMDAFANNVRVLIDRGFSDSARYCAANDPVSAYEYLQHVHAALDSGERMFVAPIGTKPHGVACALFAAETSGVGILYDHPRRKAGRSDGTGAWHLYSIRK